MEESTKKNLHPKLLLLTASVILVCIVALVAQIPKKKLEPQIDVTTTLEKIVKTSDLSTAVFQYQGIVEIPNQKNLKKIDYYICYTASVYAGIDFSEVTFSENKETKTITATLPEVKIQDTVVDPNSLDFMFQNKKADNISVLDAAFTACETDIRQECTSESALLSIAQMNAENTVRALTEPVMQAICSDYSLVIQQKNTEPAEIQAGSIENFTDHFKKYICLLSVALTLFLFTACGKTEPVEVPAPDEGQLKSICQLSVLEGYFHNVVKFEQKDAEKFLWMTKDKKAWVEYVGVAKYGLDASKVKMELSGKHVTISIPKAELLYCKVDSTSLDENAYIVDKDSATITAEDSKAILTQAQQDLQAEATDYKPLLTLAQQQAQQLMEDYVKNIVSATGSDAEQYTIEWIYLDK